MRMAGHEPLDRPRMTSWATCGWLAEAGTTLWSTPRRILQNKRSGALLGAAWTLMLST